MIYFAYGANIDPLQMRPRCPAAQVRGTARLDGYRLCFPRYSFVRQSALASIEKAAEGMVWGALYEIEEGDLPRFDQYEGFYSPRHHGDNTFNRIDVEVRHKEGDTVRAFTYQANPMAYAGEPSYEYLNQIARCAATLGFPDDYLDRLRDWGHAEVAA